MPAVTKTPNVCNVNGTGPTEICINEHTVIIATNTAILIKTVKCRADTAILFF